jgi:hypothetical protein
VQVDEKVKCSCTRARAIYEKAGTSLQSAEAPETCSTLLVQQVGTRSGRCCPHLNICLARASRGMAPATDGPGTSKVLRFLVARGARLI